MTAKCSKFCIPKEHGPKTDPMKNVFCIRLGGGVTGMGFISYNLSFYRNELQKLENNSVTQDSLRRARMLDDLADEGYTELNERLEKEFCCVSRLREYLNGNYAEPLCAVGDGVYPQNRTFAEKHIVDTEDISYSMHETELNRAVLQAVCKANNASYTPLHPTAERLHSFCRWIGYDDKTAYIFLLRDTLLPYVYYLGRGRKRIYPWLLSRKSFEVLTGQQNADDEIRASVYRALESGYTDSRSFLGAVLSDMRKIIAAYPEAENILRIMLRNIDAERILVIESGCTGTFPLLLMSLDDRVDMRMYTTYPYLTDIFGTRIFTSRYEENRIFETMVSQELYFSFSGIRDGCFYVRKCTDEAIERQSLQEIAMMLRVCGNIK